MANIISIIHRNVVPGKKRVISTHPDIFVIKVDNEPGINGGTEAPLGSFAIYESPGGIEIYYKYGTSDTEWRMFLDEDGILAAAGADERVKVSSNDSASGFLLGKLTSSTTAVSFSEVNDGGNEDVSVDVANATTSAAGLIELATQSEVDAGSSTTLAVTPATLSNTTLNLALITGDHQVLDNPISPTELADFLDSNYQPHWPTEITSYTLYVRSTGDDSANDGESVGAPFLTIQRALQKVATLNSADSRATIDIGPGTFDWPRLIAGNYVNFQGTTSVEDTFTIATVQAADDTDGIVIDVTSTGIYSADELRGRHLEWTSGTSSGNEGWCYRNDATGAHVGGQTRIYATHDSGGTTGIQSMVSSDTLDLISQDTVLSLSGASILQNSVQMNIRDVQFVATANTTFQALTTDKVDFDRCFFDGSGGFLRTFRSGGVGRAFLTNCYVATAGTTIAPFLQISNNGYLQIQRGTVLDASLNGTADPDARQVEGSGGSLIGFQGHVVCRGFDQGEIFQVDGIGIFGVGGISSVDTILVEDAHGTSTTQVGPVFKINSVGTGQGGWYQLPNLHGDITGDYTVEAQNCACIIIGTGTSTITTALGTNTVSADAGNSNISAAPDLTIIKYGSPETLGFKRRTSVTEVTSTTHSVENDEGIILVNQTAASAPTITLPLGSDHLTGEIKVKDKKGTAGTNNITISTSGGDTIDGASTFTIDGDYASVGLIYSGTEWSVV